MKTKYKFGSLIDEAGFAFGLFPMIFLGYENYNYSKVFGIYFSWLFWDFTFELHFKPKND